MGIRQCLLSQGQPEGGGLNVGTANGRPVPEPLSSRACRGAEPCSVPGFELGAGHSGGQTQASLVSGALALPCLADPSEKLAVRAANQMQCVIPSHWPLPAQSAGAQRSPQPQHIFRVGSRLLPGAAARSRQGILTGGKVWAPGLGVSVSSVWETLGRLLPCTPVFTVI